MRSRLSSCIAASTFFTLLATAFQLVAQVRRDVKHHHYKLIDIGTFGGPESYIVGTAQMGSPNQLNRRGVTVGGAGNGIPTTASSNPAVCGGFDGQLPLGVNHAFQLRDGILTDLGSLMEPDNCSFATSANARAEIVGTSENGVVDPSLGFNEIRAVLWIDGKISDLGTLGGANSAGPSINNRGQMVGWALNSVPDPYSIYNFQIFGSSQGTQTRAFLWQNGVMRDLGTLGGPDAWANFVNDRGQVAGFSYTDSTPVDNGPMCDLSNPGNYPTQHPFLWEDGKMTDLGSLGGTCAGSEVAGFQGALNNRGQVVGASTLAGNQVFHPFLWTEPGPMQDLGTLGGDCGTAGAINGAGDIVGEADTRPGCPKLPGMETEYHAFLWKKGAMTDLGTVAGDSCSFASSINSNGQIVGVSEHGCANFIQHAFLWENGNMVDLNTLIPPNSPLQLAAAGAINDRGEIAGTGVPPGCPYIGSCGHAFLLIPCDENHPDVDGCDYSEVNTAPESQLLPVREAPRSNQTGMLSWRDNPVPLPRKHHQALFGPCTGGETC